MPNTKALEILATHGVQCTVPELMELIDDDNAVLKLKFCLEAIEQALSPLEQSEPQQKDINVPESEHSENKEEWVSVETRLPETGKEVIILINELYTGTAVVEAFDDPYRLEFRNDNYEHFYSSDVTHWQPLPSPPVNTN